MSIQGLYISGYISGESCWYAVVVHVKRVPLIWSLRCHPRSHVCILHHPHPSNTHPGSANKSYKPLCFCFCFCFCAYMFGVCAAGRATGMNRAFARPRFGVHSSNLVAGANRRRCDRAGKGRGRQGEGNGGKSTRQVGCASLLYSILCLPS